MKFLMLLQMDGGTPVATDLRAEIGRKMDLWTEELAGKGALEAVLPLHLIDQGALFKKSGEVLDSIRPSQADPVVVACVAVAVNSFEEARSLAASCPHLLCGDIELREVYGS